MRGALPILLGAVVVLGALLAPASPAAQQLRPGAQALLTSGTVGARASAAVPGTGEERNTGAAAAPGVQVREGETLARGSVAAGTARASAVARTVSLLDGRITAYGVRRTVEATAAGRTFSGRVEGLVIDGRDIGKVRRPRSFRLADGRGRVFVNTGTIGLRLKLAVASGSLPAGSDVRVAVADGTVEAVEAKPAPTPTPTPAPSPSATSTPSAKPKRLSGGKARTTGLKRRKAPKAPARLTAGGFAFPVYGRASVADNFGAERAAPIVAHEGNDIFASFGAPVVAVAGGTVSRVGTLEISGNRLWLTTPAGDAFFYAHLSAFSPAAVNGAKVKAGTVLGFVGNTGDAEPTPPHLHFEVHPGGEEADAVDPYRILSSWQGRRDVPAGAWLQRNGADTTQRPGALVAVRDFIAQ
jgi:murein DD-endopeptidase MepM/ murein hydrolase activator NlpD